MQEKSHFIMNYWTISAFKLQSRFQCSINKLEEMPGFEDNRFVGLEQWLAEELKCSICLNVFNKPVMTECDHNFCLDCIQTSIRTNGTNCPQCRQPLNSRQRLRSNRNTNELNISLNENNLKINKSINNIIDKLKIKCDFESNGCKEVIELSLMSSHIKECDYNFEYKNKQLIDCKNQLNEWQQKAIDFEKRFKEFETKK